jgi:hypothetical protein
MFDCAFRVKGMRQNQMPRASCRLRLIIDPPFKSMYYVPKATIDCYKFHNYNLMHNVLQYSINLNACPGP